MRLIRTLVPETDLEPTLDVLDSYDIDYVLFAEESEPENRVLVEFPLPTQAVETVIEEVQEAGGDAETYTVVASAESVFSEHIDEMESRFITGTEEDDAIATEEIRSTALDLNPSPRTYYSMTLLSSLVATAGLLIDSPAIVVGSMVIAPVVGAALTASVGTVLNERSMIADGFESQVKGLALAIVGAAVFSYGLRSAAFLPPAIDVTTTQQISQRISPGLLSLVVGICAGAAGAFGLATGFSVTLVGVMIAAALIPAAAAVGVGVAWGIPTVAIGAFLLLVLNTIAIHVSGASVLWYLGYRPTAWPEGDRFVDGLRPSREAMRQVGPLLVTVSVLGAIFVGTGAVVSTHIVYEQQVNEATTSVLQADRYDALELVSVHAEFTNTPLVDARSQQVTLVVARPVDDPYPDLGRAIADRIRADTGREVTVVVEFVERQTEDPGRPDERVSKSKDRIGTTGEPVGPIEDQVARFEDPNVRTGDPNRVFEPEPEGSATGARRSQPFTGPA